MGASHSAESGQLAPTSPAIPENSTDFEESESEQLAESLARDHDVPINVATQMADLLRTNKKVIPAAPRKYTAVFF